MSGRCDERIITNMEAWTSYIVLRMHDGLIGRIAGRLFIISFQMELSIFEKTAGEIW